MPQLRLPKGMRVLVAGTLCTAALALSLPASAEPGFGSVQWMPPPVGDPKPPIGSYGAISCPTMTRCTAVGPSENLPIGGMPTVIIENTGVWGTPRIVAVPSGGNPSGQLAAALNAVSCAAASDCTAVGEYPSSKSGTLPMVVTEVSGAWGKAKRSALPRNVSARYATLKSVDCVATGSCTAVGFYIGTDHIAHLMAITQSAGVWGAPQRLPALPGSTQLHFAQPTSIACTTATSCVAIGIALYLAAPISVRTYAWTESSGTWARPVQLTGPKGEAFLAESIACPGTSTCFAVGSVGTLMRSRRPEVAKESDGTWGLATPLALPRLSPSAGIGVLTGISCPTIQFCEAVGADLGPNADTASAATWTNGTWSSIGLIRGVKKGSIQSDGTSLQAVSCATATRCTAVGQASPDSTARSPETYEFSTLLEPVRALRTPLPPVGVGGGGTLGGAVLRWSPPFDDGGSPIVSFTATVEPTGKACVTTADSCVIRGLANGHRYRVRVTDATAFGTSIAATSGRLVSAGTVPRPPTGVRAVGGRGTVEVFWHAAIAPAGEPVLRYVVTLRGSRGGSRRCVTRSHACRFGGLAPQATYVAHVVARDESGFSARSARASATTR